MAYTEQFSETHAITAIPPQSLSNGAANSGYLSMRDYHRAAVVVLAGALVASANVTVVVQQAKDTTGSGVKTLKSATALVGATDNNAVVVLEIRSEELDVSGHFDCIRVLITETATHAALMAVAVLRYEPRFAPVDTSGLHQVVA